VILSPVGLGAAGGGIFAWSCMARAGGDLDRGSGKDRDSNVLAWNSTSWGRSCGVWSGGCHGGGSVKGSSVLVVRFVATDMSSSGQEADI
jgi:hypothetical protein